MSRAIPVILIFVALVAAVIYAFQPKQGVSTRSKPAGKAAPVDMTPPGDNRPHKMEVFSRPPYGWRVRTDAFGNMIVYPSRDACHRAGQAHKAATGQRFRCRPLPLG